MLKPLLITSLLLTLLGLMLPVNAQRTGPGCGPTDGWCQRGMGGQSPYGRICTRNRGGRLSMRTGPGINYGKITEIPNGANVALAEGKYGDDGIYWWVANYNGMRGWIRADYVCGDPQ